MLFFWDLDLFEVIWPILKYCSCTNFCFPCALFPVSFLGVLCKCPLQNDYQEDSGAAYPLPAVKVSMDWLKLRPSVFQEAVVDERQ